MAQQFSDQVDLETILQQYRANPELLFVDSKPSGVKLRDLSETSSRNGSWPGLLSESSLSSASSSRKSSALPLLPEKEDTAEEIDCPPNGGVAAWTQALMGHLMYINTWGYITSYGIFQTYELSILGISQTNVSWVGSMQIFLLFFVGALSGRAFDAGLFRWAYTLGVALQCTGVFATSFATEYWHFVLAQGLCTGLGAGLQYTPTMSLIASYFSTRKFFAISLASCGSATGGVIFPLIVKELLPRLGFGWTLRILGFIQLGLGLVSIAFFRPRSLGKKSGPLVDFSAFRECTYVLYCGAVFMNFWALYFVTDYLTEYAEQYLHLSTDIGFMVLMVFSGIGIVGRLVPAYFADTKLGALNTVTPSVFICAILIFSWTAVKSEGALYAFCSVTGVATASVYALATAALASLTTDPSRIGVRMGMAFTIGSFAALTGPVLGGTLIESAGGNYWKAQVWAGSALTVAGFLLLSARISKTGWHLWVKC